MLVGRDDPLDISNFMWEIVGNSVRFKKLLSWRMTMELLNAAQLATRLGVSLAFVRKASMQGMPVHKIGRCARYDFNVVLAWFDSRGGKLDPLPTITVGDEAANG